MKSVMTTTLSESDMGTVLHGTATSLRNVGEALTGIACTDHRVGDLQYKSLAGLARTVERIAELLDVFNDSLCQNCRMAEVREMLGVKPFSRSKIGKRGT